MTVWDSPAAVTGVVGAITAAVGGFASWRSRGERKADQTATISTAWNDLTSAITHEVEEERELRHVIETKLEVVNSEWDTCKQRLSSMELVVIGLVDWLSSQGMEPPEWIKKRLQEVEH